MAQIRFAFLGKRTPASEVLAAKRRLQVGENPTAHPFAELKDAHGRDLGVSTSVASLASTLDRVWVPELGGAVDLHGVGRHSPALGATKLDALRMAHAGTSPQRPCVGSQGLGLHAMHLLPMHRVAPDISRAL